MPVERHSTTDDGMTRVSREFTREAEQLMHGALGSALEATVQYDPSETETKKLT